MEKINNKYTFSKAAERMVELQKRIGWLDPNFELKDQSDLLIDEFEKEDKLVDIIVKAQQDYDKLIKEYAKVINSRDELEQRVTVLTDKNKKLNEKCKQLKKENEELFRQLNWKLTKEEERLNSKINELTKQITEEKAKNDNLTKENEELTTKNKNLNKKCKQLKKEKEAKLSLSHNQDTTLSNTFISSLAASYEKSEKEKEEIHKKLQESNIQKDAFADKVATQEEEIKRLKSYINSLETKLYLKNNLGDN